MKDATVIGQCLAVGGDICIHCLHTMATHSSAPLCRLISGHHPPPYESKHTSRNMIEPITIPNPFINMLLVAVYFRVFVLSRDARCCVDACASAPEEALELGGAGAPDAGAFKMSDGPDSSCFAERSGDADGRRFCGVDVTSAFTLGCATPTPHVVISSRSLQNKSGPPRAKAGSMHREADSSRAYLVLRQPPETLEGVQSGAGST